MSVIEEAEVISNAFGIPLSRIRQIVGGQSVRIEPHAAAAVGINVTTLFDYTINSAHALVITDISLRSFPYDAADDPMYALLRDGYWNEGELDSVAGNAYLYFCDQNEATLINQTAIQVICGVGWFVFTGGQKVQMRVDDPGTLQTGLFLMSRLSGFLVPVEYAEAMSALNPIIAFVP